MEVNPVGQFSQIGVEQSHDVLLRGFHACLKQDFAGNTCIRVACKINSFQGGGATADLDDGIAEGILSCATRSD